MSKIALMLAFGLERILEAYPVSIENASSENERKYTSSNPLRQLAIQRYFSVIRNLMPPVNTILNAGCGEGFDAQRIIEMVSLEQLYGSDISYSALLQAKKVCPDMQTCVADVTRMPYKAKSVDLVLSLEVLEHLTEPQAAVQLYRQISRRYILLGVPNEPWFRLLRMMSGLNVRDFGDHPEHVQHWNLFTFKAFLQKNGLSVKKIVSPVPFIWTIALCEL